MAGAASRGVVLELTEHTRVDDYPGVTSALFALRRQGARLAVDDTGRSLAFGTTTGSCWVTDDQGDTWAALPERLPPVHAVCFA